MIAIDKVLLVPLVLERVKEAASKCIIHIDLHFRSSDESVVCEVTYKISHPIRTLKGSEMIQLFDKWYDDI